MVFHVVDMVCSQHGCHVMMMMMTMMMMCSGSDENISRSQDSSDGSTVNHDYHRFDEQVNVCLDCSVDTDMQHLPRKYIR